MCKFGCEHVSEGVGSALKLGARASSSVRCYPPPPPPPTAASIEATKRAGIFNTCSLALSDFDTSGPSDGSPDGLLCYAEARDARRPLRDRVAELSHVSGCALPAHDVRASPPNPPLPTPLP